ncbi:MAG: MBL fold metallo-hydrolase [Clostridia bacterium]|nr:MBL fold metallo-hydrolase [Clostridia bacterium]
MNEPWKGAFPPFRIFGNLYFVGTEGASTHIVDTGDGLVMLDSGYQQSLYLVLHGMYSLGLDPMKLRYILHTHGHIDHMGATAALTRLTGAKSVIGRADRDAANGMNDLSYARELGMTDLPFEPDILVDDGAEIRLGNTTFGCMATPGHTAGAMSWFFDVSGGAETFRCALHGGMGTNTMCRAYLEAHHLSYDCREQFAAAMDRLAGERADIFLGNHMQHNHTPEKYRRLLDGDSRAFIDPSEWASYCRWAKEHMLEMVRKEQQ